MRDIPEIDQTALVATVIDPDDNSHDFMKLLIQNSAMNGQIFSTLKEAIEFMENEE